MNKLQRLFGASKTRDATSRSSFHRPMFVEQLEQRLALAFNVSGAIHVDLPDIDDHMPVQGARVEAFVAGNTNAIATTYTTASGQYALTNSGITLNTGDVVTVKVISQSETFGGTSPAYEVREISGTTPGDPYEFSKNFTVGGDPNAPVSGHDIFLSSLDGAATETKGRAFVIFSIAQFPYAFATDDLGATLSDPLDIFFPVIGGSNYSPGNFKMNIGSDDWDRWDTVPHEFGHYVADVSGFLAGGVSV